MQQHQQLNTHACVHSFSLLIDMDSNDNGMQILLDFTQDHKLSIINTLTTTNIHQPGTLTMVVPERLLTIYYAAILTKKKKIDL